MVEWSDVRPGREGERERETYIQTRVIDRYILS